MKRGRQAGPRRERGIALLTAIILVALAAVLATAIAFSSAMSARRVAATLDAAQALQVAEGAEALAAYALKQDSDSQDTLASPWAQHYGPTTFQGVLLEAQVEDEQGKFNVNNLVSGGAVNTVAVAQFQRLLESLGLEDKWADLLADWIDTDNEPTSPGGAEDSVYLGQTPPYRTANLPISSISELLALPGFGHDRYERLRPYIAALPVGTKINVCTASGLVLDALSGEQEFGINPEQLAMRRQNGCFPTPDEFKAAVQPDLQTSVSQQIDQQSHYFRLQSWITIGTARFTLYSLMLRDNGQVRPLSRTFGTE